MKHFASPSFWEVYERLPDEVRRIADRNFGVLKQNPYYPSLHLKKVGRYWSVRVGRRYRALAVEIEEGLLWFWIGPQAEYDKLVGQG